MPPSSGGGTVCVYTVRFLLRVLKTIIMKYIVKPIIYIILLISRLFCIIVYFIYRALAKCIYLIWHLKFQNVSFEEDVEYFLDDVSNPFIDFGETTYYKRPDTILEYILYGVKVIKIENHFENLIEEAKKNYENSFEKK